MPERQARDSDVSSSAPPELLAELNPNTDLSWLVERVCQNYLPWVVIPQSAITAWQQRDPGGWAKVKAWLAARHVTVVPI